MRVGDEDIEFEEIQEDDKWVAERDNDMSFLSDQRLNLTIQQHGSIYQQMVTSKSPKRHTLDLMASSKPSEPLMSSEEELET